MNILKQIFLGNKKSRKTVLSFWGAMIVLFLLIELFSTSAQTIETNNHTENQPTQIEEFSEESNKNFYTVVTVVDGDTIKVNINGKVEKIRLIGINTPESVDPRRPVECFGKEAADKAKELLENTKVYLEPDPSQGDRDNYNRLLRYVFMEDGTNFNQKMIAEGYAYEYTYNAPYKYQKEFKEAESFARENGLGLWEEGVCGVEAVSY